MCLSRCQKSWQQRCIFFKGTCYQISIKSLICASSVDVFPSQKKSWHYWQQALKEKDHTPPWVQDKHHVCTCVRIIQSDTMIDQHIVVLKQKSKTIHRNHHSFTPVLFLRFSIRMLVRSWLAERRRCFSSWWCRWRVNTLVSLTSSVSGSLRLDLLVLRSFLRGTFSFVWHGLCLW